jgi:hypothetical protein
MKKILLLIPGIFFVTMSLAQHQADNWFFGLGAGISFTTGTPVDLTGSAISTTEGCSSISDTAGNVLFYTDGVSVWNRNNQVMPNGTGLLGNTTATQSALIVPKPGSVTEYYIFTVDEIGGPNGFEYSIVDMALDGGLGDVTTKNNFILGNVTEKLTAVQKTGTSDYWVAVHEWGSNAFYVYLLTASGLQAPVISNTGIVHNDSIIQNTYGQMKFNPCGDMIGVAIGYLDTVEVLYFDNASGQISNPFTLPIGYHVYGLEFSNNSSKLYVTTYDPLGTLVQFDLSVTDIDSILASKIALIVTPDIYGLQLASDGKIYVCHSFSSSLGVVNTPNLDGFASNYTDFGFDLDPNFTGIMSALSLPGFVTSWLKKEGECLVTSVHDPVEEGSVSIFPNPVFSEATIQLKQTGTLQMELKIYDALSRLVSEDILISNTPYTFNRMDLTPGIYFLKLSGDEKNYPVQKLIIE